MGLSYSREATGSIQLLQFYSCVYLPLGLPVELHHNYSNTARLCNVHYKILTRFTSAKVSEVAVRPTVMIKLSFPLLSQTFQQNERAI